jgi:R67 dihydrofolate reductase
MTSHHGSSVEDEMVDQWPSDAKFQMGDYVAKKGRALWRGKIVGWYRTDVTKLGYAIESYFELGSVQIYPETAIEAWTPLVLGREWPLSPVRDGQAEVGQDDKTGAS